MRFQRINARELSIQRWRSKALSSNRAQHAREMRHARKRLGEKFSLLGKSIPWSVNSAKSMAREEGNSRKHNHTKVMDDSSTTEPESRTEIEDRSESPCESKMTDEKRKRKVSGGTTTPTKVARKASGNLR